MASINRKRDTDMKTKLIILACTLIGPFAFGQAKADGTTDGPKTYIPVPGGKMGTIASFVPGSSITINQDAFTNPTKFVMAKGVIFEKASGAAVSPDSIQPGTRVRVGLNPDGQVDRITLLDPR